jgi:vacuolar protein sorting-associated protein 41
VVMSPNDLVLVKPRDRRDHVMWLVERRRYEEALDEVESFEADGNGNSKEEDEVIIQEIRRKYIHHLVHEGGVFFSFPLFSFY